MLCIKTPDYFGFKHVFVGETKFRQEITGLYHWVQFYLQEKHDHVEWLQRLQSKRQPRCLIGVKLSAER